jgi:hypothetical protein
MTIKAHFFIVNRNVNKFFRLINDLRNVLAVLLSVFAFEKSFFLTKPS